MAKQLCPKGRWTVRVRGTTTARGVRGCFLTEAAARRAVNTFHDKRGLERGSTRIVQAPGNTHSVALGRATRRKQK